MTDQITTESPDISSKTDRPRGKRPRAMWMVTAILGAGALAASITLGPTFFRVLDQKDTKLTMPETAAGLTRDNTPEAKETADYLAAVLRAEIELDTSASAIYLDPAAGAKSGVILFGGTAVLYNPERELDTVMKLLTDKTGSVTEWKSVDAGPLGGVMKCGKADSPEGAMSMCGWADHGSIALALFPSRTPETSAPLFLTLRTATQSR